MLRRTRLAGHKMPRNLGVAPSFDTWNEKYEAWGHMRKMGKLAGTGFYIPPAWYQHFRMFPPTNHQFTEEKTLNPHNGKDDVQAQLDGPDAARRAVRDELARKSRTAASTGMRYMNLFWVQKPLDQMEREYNTLTKKHGIQHDQAIKKVLQTHHEKMAVRNRAHLIQAEEAKLKGGFISMREAMSVLNVLNTVQNERLAPHQYAALANNTEEYVANAHVMDAKVVTREVTKEKPAADKLPEDASKLASDTETPADGDEAKKTTDEKDATSAADKAAADKKDKKEKAGSAKTVGNVTLVTLEEETETVEEIHAMMAEGDSLTKLRERAMDGTASPAWYRGSSPVVHPEKPKPV